jgi:hypothetical protein
MTPVTTRSAIHTAAVARQRVRVQGVVADRGEGYSGTYRNTWLRIAAAGASIRLTAGNSSPLGRARRGASVDVAFTLTGLVDVSTELYYGQRAQVVALDDAIA